MVQRFICSSLKKRCSHENVAEEERQSELAAANGDALDRENNIAFGAHARNCAVELGNKRLVRWRTSELPHKIPRNMNLGVAPRT